MARRQVPNNVHKMEIPCRDVNRRIDWSVVRYDPPHLRQLIDESMNHLVLYISYLAVYQIQPVMF